MQDLEKLFNTYGDDLVTTLEKKALDKELNENYKDILVRIRSKLNEAELPAQIGVAPLLMDFYVNEDVILAYHHNYIIELSSTSTGNMFYGPKMSPVNFEIFANRLIDLKKKKVL